MSFSNFGQFIEIYKPNLYLSLYRGFLEIQDKTSSLARIPLDDILGLMITGYGCSHSSNILGALADRGVPVSICGDKFMPKAILLPVVGNCKQSSRVRHQFYMSKPLKKRLWKQVVQSKLKHQSLVLKEYDLNYEGLLHMSSLVKLGDVNNLEAQGAKRYWKTLFSKDFKRDTQEDGVNAMLNYAYAIIRSCVARGVVVAGLHPSFGIHHQNTYNPMCLVDDLMEPFRPIGDYIVKKLATHGYSEVNKEVKEILAKISVAGIEFKSELSPLFHVVANLSSNMAMVLSKEKKVWDIKSLKIDFRELDKNIDNLLLSA